MCILNYKLFTGILLSILSSLPVMGQSEYKIFGHRGCRGIYPENTIEGFKKAISLGVDGIELDIVVNKNKELIISHESYIDTNYCLTGNLGDKKLNIYKMNITEIQEIDCGSKLVKGFPNQIKVKEKILKHRTCLWISQIIKKVLVPMQPLMFDLTTEMSHTLATKRPSRI